MKYVIWVMLLVGVILVCTGAMFTDEVFSFSSRMSMIGGGIGLLVIGSWFQRRADANEGPRAPMS